MVLVDICFSVTLSLLLHTNSGHWIPCDSVEEHLPPQVQSLQQTSTRHLTQHLTRAGVKKRVTKSGSNPAHVTTLFNISYSPNRLEKEVNVSTHVGAGCGV